MTSHRQRVRFAILLSLVTCSSSTLQIWWVVLYMILGGDQDTVFLWLVTSKAKDQRGISILKLFELLECKIYLKNMTCCLVLWMKVCWHEVHCKQFTTVGIFIPWGNTLPKLKMRNGISSNLSVYLALSLESEIYFLKQKDVTLYVQDNVSWEEQNFGYIREQC